MEQYESPILDVTLFSGSESGPSGIDPGGDIRLPEIGFGD